jgi:hypothetical protein
MNRSLKVCSLTMTPGVNYTFKRRIRTMFSWYRGNMVVNLGAHEMGIEQNNV